MPLTVHVFGVVHQDALGKVNLINAMEALLGEIGTPPVFVAVEYDRVKFHEMKGQRDRFRQELCEWRAVPPDVLAPLVASLAYEPDAVDDVFPAIPCVWLEEGATAGTDTLSKRWSTHTR